MFAAMITLMVVLFVGIRSFALALIDVCGGLVDSRAVVTTLAGNGASAFVDGSGSNARFNSPWGLAVDASGNVYVADRTNQRIRKVTANGGMRDRSSRFACSRALQTVGVGALA